MKKRTIAAATLLALSLVAAPAAHADEAWDKQVKAEIAYFKKYAKKTKDPHKWAELVMNLVGTQHP